MNIFCQPFFFQYPQESLSSLMAAEETVSQEELLTRFRTIISENLELKGTYEIKLYFHLYLVIFFANMLAS